MRQGQANSKVINVGQLLSNSVLLFFVKIGNVFCCQISAKIQRSGTKENENERERLRHTESEHQD